MRALVEITPDNVERYIGRLVEIEKYSFSAPWTYADYLTEVARPISHIVAVVDGDELLGYGGFWQVLDEAEVNNVAVAEECREQGIGRLLMEGLLDLAALLGCVRVNLEVRAGNVAAIKLYDRLGFEQVGLRAGYYTDPVEDAVLMSCDISSRKLMC